MRGKGEGSIYRQKNGLYAASVELPSRDGTRRKKVKRRKLKKDAIEALADMIKDLKERGDLPTSGQTVAQWFSYWLDNIAAKEVRPKTIEGYRVAVNNHIIPAIGKVKLDSVTAAHVRRVHDSMIIDKGLSSTTALLTHRIMAKSFKIAHREGRIGRNPANLTDAPRKAVTKLEALDLTDALALLEHVAQDEQMGARWAAALLTGGRRGEVIGLEWDRVTDVLDLSWQLLRLPITETDGKPDVPADYEYRHLVGGLYLTRPKSNKGWRIIPLVDPLKSILERHREMSPPNPYGLVFMQGERPIDPDQDSKNWRVLLAESGITKNVRLHDVRHTTVDLLDLAGVPDDIIMEIVGHSTRQMTQQYKSRGNRERLTKAMQQLSALFSTPNEGTHLAIGE
jgi:integrase